MYKPVFMINFIFGILGIYTLQYEWYRGQFTGVFLSGQDSIALKTFFAALVVVLINGALYYKKYRARCVLSKFNYSFVFVGSIILGICTELILLMVILMFF
jgi:hypothetical protein